jgi:hypothetical protein
MLMLVGRFLLKIIVESGRECMDVGCEVLKPSDEKKEM